MQKKYIVRLHAIERHHFQEVLKNLSGSSQRGGIAVSIVDVEAIMIEEKKSDQTVS